MLPITKWLQLLSFISLCKSEKVLQQYLSIERVHVTLCDPAFCEAKAWTQRYSRKDYLYYFNLELTTKIWVGNNFTIDFYFYEFLSNRYKPSFVEIHFKACDFIQKSTFIAANVRQGKLLGSCPYPPAFYPVLNVTVMPSSLIPKGFPFTKGRIYLNASYTPAEKVIASGYADIELKYLRQRSN